MTYRNKATGFVFSTECEIKAEGWEKLDPQPTISEEKKVVKPKKRTKNNEELCDN